MSLFLCMVLGGVLISGLENSMVSVVRGVAKSRTRLSAFHITSLYELTLVSAVQKSESALCIHISHLVR